MLIESCKRQLFVNIIDMRLRKILQSLFFKELVDRNNELIQENKKLLNDFTGSEIKIKENQKKHDKSIKSLMDELTQLKTGLYLKDRRRIENILEFNHELINPLNIAISYIDDILQKEPDIKEISFVKTILDKMIGEISNSLEEERLNLGVKIYNHNQIANLSNIILGISEIYKPVILNKNVELKTNITKDLFVRAAPEAIEKIFTNLVENAIKYTPEEGQITLGLELNNSKISFFVKDTGLGIPKEELKHIFVPFYRLKTSVGNDSYGLGLSLVKKLVEDIKGEITVKSDYNKGAEFVVSINNYKLKSEDEISDYTFTSDKLPDRYEDVGDVEELGKRETILIVDDNISMLYFFKDKLQANYNIYFAKNGNDALKKLGGISVVPDLIICDIIMDEMDGIKFKQVLNSHEEFKCIPFIFLSVKSFFKDKLEGMEQGSIDYVFKPFKWPDFKSKIEAVISTTKAQKEKLLSSVGNKKFTDEDFEQFKQEKFDLNCTKFDLSNQEKKIVDYLFKSKSNKDIADKLNISPNTLSVHITHIYNKLQVNSRVEAMQRMYNF